VSGFGLGGRSQLEGREWILSSSFKCDCRVAKSVAVVKARTVGEWR
jgi:hypothetical protein